MQREKAASVNGPECALASSQPLTHTLPALLLGMDRRRTSPFYYYHLLPRTCFLLRRQRDAHAPPHRPALSLPRLVTARRRSSPLFPCGLRSCLSSSLFLGFPVRRSLPAPSFSPTYAPRRPYQMTYIPPECFGKITRTCGTVIPRITGGSLSYSSVPRNFLLEASFFNAHPFWGSMLPSSPIAKNFDEGV